MRALRARATQAAEALDLELAHDLYDAGHVLGEAAQAFEPAAECLAGLAVVAQYRGENARAREYYRAALPRLTDPVERLHVRTRNAFAWYDEGKTTEARRELTRILAEPAPRSLAARALGYLGNVARAEGQWHEAEQLYAESRAALHTLGDDKFDVTFTMDAGITALLAGDAATALSHFESVRLDPVLTQLPHLAALIRHYDALAQLHLGLPWRAAWADDPGPLLPINRFLGRARTLLGDPSPPSTRLAELHAEAPENAHARITLDLFETIRLGRSRGREPDGLLVSRSGAFFRLGSEPAVVLGQRVPLTRLVRALGLARHERPGQFVESERLVECAWPGELLTASSGKNRLHVALSTLRTLGLRAVLQGGVRGYRLDPDVRTVLTA